MNGLILLTNLVGDNTKQVIRISIIRIYGQNLSVDPLSMLQLPGLMMS